MIIMISPMPSRCKNCTATCCGYDRCQAGISGNTLYQYTETTVTANATNTAIYPIPEIKEPVKYQERKGDRKGYWKSPVERRFKRG
jgi:hypothetical protein